ncbi:SpoIIE family protein phosphatase [Spirulina sp. CS-785/01]|uniref:PP2C family protein-serine/threonine phosphatase n=1 Tax=Spirulina sp. CS-785/01 TaxID=3021716 RepID=UPI00232B96C0|nr:SpoIIE family protein phosphatase [Spirulina sp. CS-785/01]MDB9315860.1 SpoIIE family protein phosphatase [Spirulina sp. CS-785/01]
MVRILVIDDDPAIQLLLKRTLATQGYEVFVASDGLEGLEKAKELTPAMVICDWVMPRLNGIELCRRLKTLPDLSTTFFILLTSKGSIEDRVEGLDAGADDFLCKPIEMFELQARVRAGLRLHQLSSDLQQQKRLLEAELAEAAEYVCSILPEPIAQPSVQINSRFIPSSQLGGDSFDYYWLDEDHLVLYLLDVSGHGLRAALPSLSVINLLRSRELLQVNYRQPGDVLRGLNDIFQMTQRNDKYFTMWYGVYNRRSRQLVYSSAGHPPALLLTPHSPQDWQVNALKTPGLPAGMFPEIEYEEDSCYISPHSSLFLFSDGVYEVHQEDGNVLGLEQFIALLKAYQLQPQRNLDQIIAEIQAANAHPALDDDASILEIKFP